MPPHTSPLPLPATPVTPPPVPRLAAPPAKRLILFGRIPGRRTRKLTEKGRVFEQKIEAEKDHLAKVRAAAAARRGEGVLEVVGSGGSGRNAEGDESGGGSHDDENAFVGMCKGGEFENEDSSATAASWDASARLRCRRHEVMYRRHLPYN